MLVNCADQAGFFFVVVEGVVSSTGTDKRRHVNTADADDIRNLLLLAMPSRYEMGNITNYKHRRTHFASQCWLNGIKIETFFEIN